MNAMVSPEATRKLRHIRKVLYNKLYNLNKKVDKTSADLARRDDLQMVQSYFRYCK